MNNTIAEKSGLSERDTNALVAVFKQHSAIEEIWIFGSRAKGNYKKGSDIDLAIMNKGVSEREVNRIKTEIEESSLPYIIDLIDFTTLQHRELKEHIERVGVSFYKR
jgi:uncharacterized protein